MMNKALFSSKTDQWATPPDFFAELDREFHFDLDPCADESNHKTPEYFTKEQDGLLQDWSGRRVFCNPPYGRAIAAWVEKAYREGTKDGTIGTSGSGGRGSDRNDRRPVSSSRAEGERKARRDSGSIKEHAGSSPPDPDTDIQERGKDK